MTTPTTDVVDILCAALRVCYVLEDEHRRFRVRVADTLGMESHQLQTDEEVIGLITSFRRRIATAAGLSIADGDQPPSDDALVAVVESLVRPSTVLQQEAR